MNIYVTGATGVVRSQYGTFGLNVTTPKKAILQVVYSGADEALIYDDMPLVYHVESLDFSKELVTRADLVIVPSHHASDYVGLYRDTPPVIVPPGIDFAGSVTSDINGGYILWDGLTNEHLDLLRQVASLDRSHQYIVRFEDLPRMGSNVVTLPPSAVDRWNELISEAGVYVTSTHELHPPTLVRALLCGIPIVALDRGSLQHLVIHSTNGVMSPATADGVIHGINYCLQYRFVLGSNSRAIARGFDWSIVMPELASLYTKVAGSPRCNCVLT